MTHAMVTMEGLGKRYRVYRKPVQRLMSWLSFGKYDPSQEIWALRDLTLSIEEGETVGIIGENGAGKSTLLKLISKTTFPSHGTMNIQGRVAALLELGAGFHPEFTGRENIRLNAALLGFSGEEIRSREDEIIEFSGLGDSADRPVKTYSSGMVVRLGFSVASHLDPDIFLVDEVLAVGDEAFRVKCLNRFNQFRDSGKTMVFVSHDMRLIRMLCRRAILLDNGRLIADGEVESVVQEYLELVEKRRMDNGSQVMETMRTDLHRGSGEIRIEEVTLRNDKDQVDGQFVTGKPYEVRIRYRALQDVEAPVVVVQVLRMDGTLCMESFSWESVRQDIASLKREEIREQLSSVSAGDTCEWTFRTPELLLLGGDYYLSVKVYNFHQPIPIPLDEITQASKFTVLSGKLPYVGVFHHPGEWKRLS